MPLQVESQKPPRERRTPPPAPAELDKPLPTTPEEIDAFNARMFDVYNGKSLVPCQHCGRTMRWAGGVEPPVRVQELGRCERGLST